MKHAESLKIELEMKAKYPMDTDPGKKIGQPSYEDVHWAWRNNLTWLKKFQPKEKYSKIK